MVSWRYLKIKGNMMKFEWETIKRLSGVETRGIKAMQDNTDVFVRKPEVRKITGLSDTTIWRLERAQKFTQRRRLSSSACGWLLSEVLAWVRSRPAEGMQPEHLWNIVDNTVEMELLKKSVDDLELTVRSTNVLRHERIITIGDLVKKSDFDILRMENIGRKALNEIKESLAKHGLSLRCKSEKD
jgi:DNA-directed RNA polymerase alpha subunit